MKNAKKIVLAAALLSLAFAGSALAFHGGGVAECEGCHTMHNSSDGVAMSANANSMLLQGSDQSSTCLVCHGKAGISSYHILGADAAGDNPATLPNLNTTPGGDFEWLKQSFSWLDRDGITNMAEPGERHGHNIVALDKGIAADTTLTTAPGGTFDASKLACSSCHDPHGKYRIKDDGTVATSGVQTVASGSTGTVATATGAVGVYRILGGAGYAPQSYGDVPFTSAPPVAVAPSTYNRSETLAAQTRVAYGEGMSEWCANCHTDLLVSAGDTKHPSGNGVELGTAFAANYNSYVKSGDMSNVDATKGYDSLVPFEEGTNDRTVLTGHAKTNNSAMAGATATSNVSCLSCHRAHASGWNHMARWQNDLEFITSNGAYMASDNANATGKGYYHQGRTTAVYEKAMNGRVAADFATYQRSLCNKCHAKD
jgi:hypothetical protein